MEGVAVLRQLVGQIQELCDLYGSPSPPPLHQHHYQRCFLLDLDNSLDDSLCHFITEGKPRCSKMVEANKSPPAKKSRREKNLGKLPATASSTEVMEQRIWKEFPEDLIEAVMARLPVTAFFRFQSVCQKWNALLTSHSFSQQCAEVPQAYPWFYMTTRENDGVIYDPSQRKWHHPTIPSLPARKIILPATSAGGLVCLLDIGHRNFFVCNPLTRSFKKLPPRSVQDSSRVAVGMILYGNSTRNGYKIMWLGCNGDHEVYDSVQDSWSPLGIMPSSIKGPLYLNFRSQPLSIGSSLYFMHSNPDGIVSYDIANGVWKQFIIPLPPYLTDHMLAECDGRIMLVGLLTKNAATCVCIWELQKMTLLWKEVDRMPNMWCLELYGKHIRMTCLGNRGLLMLSLRSRQMNRLVTYDLSNREWRKVPACILPRGRKRQWITCGIAFHPCLTAFA